MITISIALIIVLTIAFVAYPLSQRTQELDIAFVGAVDPAWEILVTQRDAAYGALKDLENEHTMGKLSDADYRSLRAKYETKAVAILQELDRVTATKPSSRKNVTADEDIERDVMQLRRASTKTKSFCHNCGTPHAPNDLFCSKCGTSLRGNRCPECGTRASPNAKFCGKCGATIDGNQN